MTPEVRALLRPVVTTVALLLALALGAVACLLVLLNMVRGSTESFLPVTGAATLPPLVALVALRGRPLKEHPRR
jgi:hypothetical protein